MEKIELKPGAAGAPADLSTFNADDRLLCFSNSAQSFGYVKGSLLKSYRYAWSGIGTAASSLISPTTGIPNTGLRIRIFFESIR